MSSPLGGLATGLVLDEGSVLGQRILAAIESIAGDEFCEDINVTMHLRPEKLNEREKTAARKLTDVYMLAHAFNRSNSCYRVHDNWRARLSEFGGRPDTPEAQTKGGVAKE